jgi:hypothetical protein
MDAGFIPTDLVAADLPVHEQADRYRSDVGLHLSQVAEADELLTSDPLALLVGMVLDQQIG